MSPREKKLLMLFLVAGFVLLNFLGIAKYRQLKSAAQDRIQQAERAVATAELFRDSREQAMKDMEWLSKNEPAPAANQDVQAALLAYATAEARNAGLEIRKQEPQATDTTPGKHFHRARVLIDVSGREMAFYQWISQLNSPDKLRCASKLILSVNPQDDTKIDCKTLIEQWFVPLPPGA